MECDSRTAATRHPSVLIDLPAVPADVVDCTDPVTNGCATGKTLGEMQAEETASPLNTVLEPTAHFGQLWSGGDNNGGGTSTRAQLLGDVTLGDVLLGIYPAGSFPFDRLSVDEIVAATDPSTVDTIDYDVDFTLSCPSPAATVTVNFPNPRFRHVYERIDDNGTTDDIEDDFLAYPTVFTFGGAGGTTLTPPAPTEIARTNGLSWDLAAGDACAAAGADELVNLRFEVTTPPDIGTMPVTALVSTGGTTVRATDSVDIGESNGETNDEVASAPALERDSLHLGQFADQADVNYYKVPVTSDDVDALLLASLSSVNSDNDLVLYGQAPINLSARDASSNLSARGIGDREGCLPQGFALETETLDNVPALGDPTFAVRSFSTARENPLEVVCTVVDEADVANGFVLLQVSHYPGDTAPLSPVPYTLNVTFDKTRDTVGCTGPDMTTFGDGATFTSTEYPNTIGITAGAAAAHDTLFLINEDRFGDIYGNAAEAATLAKIQLLAARPEVNGAILPVELDPEVAAAYAALNGADACSPALQNAVVKEITDLVSDVTNGEAPKYVVIVGDDDIVPFARLKDLTSLGNQIVYAPEVRGLSVSNDPVNNPTSKAFARGYFLSDDPYGTFTEPFPWGGNYVYIPDTSLGRLVETPSEIQAQVDQYVTFGGELDPKTALITGADTANDVAHQIADDQAKRATGMNNEVQDVSVGTATAGTFTLTFMGDTTTDIPIDAPSDDVQDALEALPGIGNGAVSVGGSEGGPWRVEFVGDLREQDVDEMTATASGDFDGTLTVETLHDGNAADEYGTSTLYTSGVDSDGPWTREDLICRFQGYKQSIITGCLGPQGASPGTWSANGHFSHVSTLNGDGDPEAQTTTADLVNPTSLVPDGVIMFTIGCNSGVSVPDVYIGGPRGDDWAQAVSQKKGILVANQGFGYGDLTRLAYSEKLMRLFSANLDGSFRIGPALTEAKGDYWTSLVSFSPYDVKSMEQSIFYGLPMYTITGNGTPETHVAPPLVTDDGYRARVLHRDVRRRPFEPVHRPCR